jgi:hypothetical protein
VQAGYGGSIERFQGADGGRLPESETAACDRREHAADPAESETPCTHRKLHAREPGGPAVARGSRAGRRENARSGMSLMHDSGESYSGIVPTKQPNKSGEPPAEAVEGRPLTKDCSEAS